MTVKRKIAQLFVDMVALDTRPDAVVEGTGFNLSYKVPSAVHVVTCLKKRYSQVKGIIERKLEEANYVALTSDI